MSYKKINNITGWGVFGFALIVYLMTVAPTASFWDCGEFIACSNELEVTHPPGAPFFLMLGRIFAMVASFTGVNVAFMVNLISVFSGAFTVLFTFWSITHLAQKGLRQYDMAEDSKTISTMFAGVVGALACTFADSVWFNTVEAEVYAMSSFFTAIVFWLMLKWEERADEKDNLKWLVLIAYVMGLSTGVHLLNLLTIPALALIYYFRKFDFSWIGFGATMGVSVVILAIIQYGVMQIMFEMIWTFEQLFTGTVSRRGVELGGMGLPMGTGALIFAVLLIGSIVGLLVYSIRTKNVVLNTAVLCFVMILIGFSSYTMIFVRSGANPPIDMNNPEDLLTYLSYMKREQYGDRPLLSGTTYNAQPVGTKEGEMKYMLLEGQDKYVEDTEKTAYEYKDDAYVMFPRMYSPGHYKNAGVFSYINYVSDKGATDSHYDDNPTRGEDFKFFLDYQVRHMYLRYFMWNFVGRSSDLKEADWESGLNFTTTEKLSEERRNNKGRNHYFFLPLLLGLFGLVWQSVRSGKDAAIVGLLFFFTGFAIIIYLNQYPNQPRERDYSYAGSFQTFCIWIGLGVLFLVELLDKYLKKSAPYAAGGLALLAPFLMGFYNWDDHSRHGRYVDVEFAYNLLNSCEENAILFTGGDNDTFPLWYVQEVEGFRTDIRVVNLELFVSDWYVEQKQQPENGTPPVPLTMKPQEYAGDANMVFYGYRSKNINIPVYADELVRNGVIKPSEAELVDSVMVWPFKGRGSETQPYILRKDTAVINMVMNVAKDGWKRPIYFANTINPSSFIGLTDFLQMEGMAYRVLPIKKSNTTTNDIYYGRINQEKMYDNVINKFKYTNLDDPSVSYDEHIRKVIVNNYRTTFIRLMNSYADQVRRLQARNDQLRKLMETGGENPEFSTEISTNEGVIDQKVDTIKTIVAFAKEKLPYNAVSPKINFVAMEADLLDSIGLTSLAKEDYEVVAALLPDEMRFRSNARLSQDKMQLQIGYRAIQFFARIGEMGTAETFAEEMATYTGDMGIMQALQKYKQEQKAQPRPVE